MESTGVEWIPLFQILSERKFEVFLVNAKSVKTVPEGEIAVLRNYLRQRENLVQNSSTHVQRRQKARSSDELTTA